MIINSTDIEIVGLYTPVWSDIKIEKVIYEFRGSMGNENSMIPSPKPSPKAEGQAVSSNSTAFPYVRGSREARLRSHKVIIAC